MKAVDGVDFSVNKKQSVGVVGESGCGKSITCMSIMRFIPQPPGRIEEGNIYFYDENILNYSERDMRGIRGNNISMIFQEPITSLPPVFTVGDQIMEYLLLHQGMNHKEAKERAIKMLDTVGIPRANQVVDEYPHQLSGEMRQRAMIVMVSCDPKLLIADESTTALDVIIQAQILELMNDLKERYETRIILITHDLGIVAEKADEVVVMYAGRVVEHASVYDIFDDPKHPYTII
ncbi:ABC transporter ATP-binding protein [Natranaerobius trueperi]|uniref:ABC transporter ATP-binding protein n=1 Tax=Natranaerobius trueperi TaxID=759412 RepID=UPI001F0B2FA3|nr:ABC transporter ATP-binding protein [Natranaerobius trueperi]